ncbi:MAG: hypothetical protein HN580_21515 [Deltaproteobacteria bacterium]|jgi:hypothetical protein|nr:hypothetical protein [Deltaproteobacteria bacterium]MBT4089641.1 hypothetical protein [Deltaproteobacteria bacterium]MBT4265455.1 hypothetical protein [Deltaproteobacteria bacterium]MBT4642824.1 hypothetical protein [Deltaproteobacteria bacterium]MBT6499325.1 hypothetical protein [Deltaproteobacteria bacterium]
MSDTLFLQFYNKIKNSYYDLCNGFSDTYDLCRSKGDFYWTEHEVDNGKWFDEDTYTDRKLPIDKGTIYISAIYINHLYQAYIWARSYPKIRFIVGGPVAAERMITAGKWNPIYIKVDDSFKLPSNLEFTGKSVEDWFGVPNFSGDWKLDIPTDIPSDSKIYFSYTLDNRCYWRKCIYCNIALHAKEVFRQRENIDCEFNKLDHKGMKIVRLNTGSITPKFVKEVLPVLPHRPDLDYRMFIRSGQIENRALESTLRKMNGKIPNLVLGFGMEFPSNRMLKYGGKGFKTDELLDFLNLAKEFGLLINANFMLGWNNLIEEDLEELEVFMSKMPDSTVTTAQIRWLLAPPYTQIHDTYEGESIQLGPFYEGFRVAVNEEQKILNRRARDIVSRYSKIKNFVVQGLVSIEKYMN